MKIESIGYRMGSKIVDYLYILDQIKKYSKDGFNGDIDSCVKIIEKFFIHSGSSTFNWLDKKEKPIDLLIEAINDVLNETGIDKNDIDLLIYAGTFGGFAEPGRAYPVAKALDMKKTRCLDIMDACNSWTTSMEISNNMLKTDSFNNIMIINMECINDRLVFPESEFFKLQNKQEIKHTFAIYTSGDAVSATLVSPDGVEPKFFYKSYPAGADLCAFPYDGYDFFCGPSKKWAVRGLFKVYSYMLDMQKVSFSKNNLFDELLEEKLEYLNISKFIFTHSHSESVYYEKLNQFNINPEKIRNIFRIHGNLGAATIPIGLKKSIDKKELNRGDNFCTLTPSSGMSFSISNMVY